MSAKTNEQQKITIEQFLVKQVEELDLARDMQRRVDSHFSEIIKNYKGVCKSLNEQVKVLNKKIEQFETVKQSEKVSGDYYEGLDLGEEPKKEKKE